MCVCCDDIHAAVVMAFWREDIDGVAQNELDMRLHINATVQASKLTYAQYELE